MENPVFVDVFPGLKTATRGKIAAGGKTVKSSSNCDRASSIFLPNTHFCGRNSRRQVKVVFAYGIGHYCYVLCQLKNLGIKTHSCN